MLSFLFKYKKDNLSLEFPDHIIAIPIVALETWTTFIQSKNGNIQKSQIFKQININKYQHVIFKMFRIEVRTFL